MFENLIKDFKDINIEDYEIFVCELMYDVFKYIENVFIELLSFIENVEYKKFIEEIIVLIIGGKEIKWVFDYRCVIINVLNRIKGVVDVKV